MNFSIDASALHCRQSMHHDFHFTDEEDNLGRLCDLTQVSQMESSRMYLRFNSRTAAWAALLFSDAFGLMKFLSSICAKSLLGNFQSNHCTIS